MFTIILIALLANTAESGVVKRSLDYAKAWSNSNGAVDNGDLGLYNQAYSLYSNPDYFSAGAYGSSEAQGTGASFQGAAGAKAVGGSSPNNKPNHGKANGHSEGSVGSGTISNSDYAYTYQEPGFGFSYGESAIDGSGSKVVAGSGASSSQKKSKAYVNSNSVSSGSADAGQVNLNNNANSQYNANWYPYPYNNPSMSADAYSDNLGSGTKVVINSASNVAGNNNGLDVNRPHKATGNAGNSASGSGSLSGSQSVYASSYPGYFGSAYGSGASSVTGTGTGLVIGSNAGSSIKQKSVKFNPGHFPGNGHQPGNGRGRIGK